MDKVPSNICFILGVQRSWGPKAEKQISMCEESGGG